MSYQIQLEKLHNKLLKQHYLNLICIMIVK